MLAADKGVPATPEGSGLLAAGPAGDVRQRFEDAARVARHLAHDYGNLLTAILGFADLALVQVGPDSPLRPYLAEIHQAAVQGAQFTNRLRQLTPRPVPQGARASLSWVVAEEKERLQPLWGTRVRFQCSLADDLPPLATDAETVRLALGALLDNAGEAVDGEGMVTVSARPVYLTAEQCAGLFGRPEPAPYLEITLADTGRGFSPEARQKLLREPFFTTKPRHRGLGMAAVCSALAVCRGGFRLDAGPEGGTVARLYLPAAAAPSATAREAQPGGERVLVVDDDPMVLRLVCATLNGAGYRAQPAANAAEAMAAFSGAGPEPFCLVLSDVLMPRMSGVELARRLRDRDPAVNVLFMSGQVCEDFPRAGPPTGDIALVNKPFRAEGLLRAVRAALERRTCPHTTALPGVQEHSAQPSRQGHTQETTP